MGFGGSPEPQFASPPPPPSMGWPDKASVRLARQGQNFRGQPDESILTTGLADTATTEQVLVAQDAPKAVQRAPLDNDKYKAPNHRNTENLDDLTAAKLAAERSPIAKLGFDANAMSFNTDRDATKISVNGITTREGVASKIWANLPNSKTTPVHESMHRGAEIVLDYVKNNPDALKWQLSDSDSKTKAIANDVVNMLKTSAGNEKLVRALMYKHFGDRELKGQSDPDQVAMGKAFLEKNPEMVDAFERLGQLALDQRTRKMGPR